MSDAAVREHTAVLVGGGEIVALGDERELIAAHRDATIVDCPGTRLSPPPATAAHVPLTVLQSAVELNVPSSANATVYLPRSASGTTP